MTLVITEVSVAGIAMMSDTMISFVDRDTGRILAHRTPEERPKLFIIGPLAAGVSYWGDIGLVPDFNNWLTGFIQKSQAMSLSAFAKELACSLNNQCNGHTIKGVLGLHVAGFEAWEDIYPRPKFYHIHNGHIETTLTIDDAGKIALAPTGSRNVQEHPQTRDEGKRRSLIASHTGSRLVFAEEVKADRGPFVAHLDFPSPDQSLEKNLQDLETGYLTANGDYFRLTLKREFEALMTARGLRAIATRPRDAGYLKKSLAWMVESAERIRKDKARDGVIQTFGGPYQEVAIDENGFRRVCGPYLPSVG